MKYSLLLISLLLTTGVVAQDEEKTKDRLFLGIHGAPLVNIADGNFDLIGFMISPGVYYNLNKKFTLAAVPFYGRTSETTYHFYNMNTGIHSDERLNVYQSVGLNIQLRYSFTNLENRPYVMAFGGPGYTWEKVEYLEEPGRERKNSFMTMTYGFGLGYDLKLNETINMDFNIQSGWIMSVEDPAPSLFLIPSVGIIKKL